jgi:hypothetical protein
VIKARRWAGYAARMGEKKNAFSIFGWKPSRKLTGWMIRLI